MCIYSDTVIFLIAKHNFCQKSYLSYLYVLLMYFMFFIYYTLLRHASYYVFKTFTVYMFYVFKTFIHLSRATWKTGFANRRNLLRAAAGV